MAQNFREMLSNRRFAIPLIALLGICFIGLLLLGFVLILPSLRSDTEPVAEAKPSPSAVAPTDTQAPPTPTTEPTNTPKPTATLVPIGTTVDSGAGEATDPVLSGGEAEATAIVEEEATGEPTEEEATGDQSTATPEIEDEELAETGIGWGLILVSGVGLAGVAAAARRLRLAG